MKKLFTLIAIAFLLSTPLLAHGGHKHNYLGSVKLLHENHLVVTLKDGSEKTFVLTGETKLMKNEKAATRADLVNGARVAIQVKNDDTTAVKVKIGTTKQ